MISRQRSIDWLQNTGLIFVILSLVHVQGYTPVFTWKSASAFQEKKALYVQGGIFRDVATNTTQDVSQLFSIDLSVPWDTSSVPYKEMKSPGPVSLRAATLTRDGQSIVMFGEQIMMEYSIPTNTWKQRSFELSRDCDSITPCLGSAMNPATGLIYFQSVEVNNTVSPSRMVQYNPSNGDARFATSIEDYQGVLSWNNIGKSLILLGTQATSIYRTISYWDLESRWGTIPVGGSIPSQRTFPCLVPAYDGTKQILFGGGKLDIYLSDIYILDLKTMVWTQGTSAGSENGRMGMACAVTNDFFIAWGGAAAKGSVQANETLIYNLKTNQWQTTFSPNPDSSRGLMIGLIVGGLVVVIGAIGFYIFVRRKRAGGLFVKKSKKVPQGIVGSQDQPNRDPQETLMMRDPQEVVKKRDPEANTSVDYGNTEDHLYQKPSSRNPQELNLLPLQNYGFDTRAGHFPRDPHCAPNSNYVEPMSLMRSKPLSQVIGGNVTHNPRHWNNRPAAAGSNNIEEVNRGEADYNDRNSFDGGIDYGGMHGPVHPPQALNPLLNNTFEPGPETWARHPEYISARFGSHPNFHYDTTSTVPRTENSQMATRPRQPQDHKYQATGIL